MALNFPDSPTLNQEYAAGSRLWRWNGTRWISASGVLYNSQINDISDVSITSVANGDFLRYNGSASAWINDPVNLGTDTTGNYVADVIGGTGITVSHTPGEGSSASVALNATLDDLSNVDAASPSDGQFLKYVSASTAWVPANIPTINNLDDVGDVTAPTPSSGDFLKWNGSAWVNDAIDLGTDTTGNYMSGVTAGTGITISHTPGEGSSASISVTSNTYQPINSTLTILGTVSPDSNLLPYFTSNGSASTTPITYSARTILDDSSYSAMRDTMGIGTGNTVTFAGATLGFTRVGVTAAGEIDTVAGDLTIDSAGGTTTIDDNLIVSGNLTVNGTTTTLNTDTLSVEDNIIVLNSNVSGSPVLNAGIEVERGTSTNVAVRWNETSNKWELTNDGAAYEDIATEGYVNGLTYSLDDLTDVESATPADGQFLKYVSASSAWVPANIPTINNLDDVGDVTITSAVSGQFLKWNGSAWVNDAIDLGTDTVGNYVSGVTGGTGVTVTHTPGEGSSPSIAIGQDVATTASVSFAAVTAPVIGNASTATTLQNVRTISLGGDLSGSASFNGSSDVTITATVQPNSVDLGTDTTGNYVQSLVAGTGITLTNGTASEGGTPTIAVTANTYQPLDADLTAIAGLAGTSGVLKKTATDTWALDTSTFVTTADTGTVTSAMISNGTIVDADINTSAAIAHSKLANATAGQVLLGTTTTGVVTATTLSGDVTIDGGGVTAIASGAIVNADINASAAIALSKLASGTSGQIIVANASGVPTWVSESGDISISDTGVTEISSGVIVNADINASAAIDKTKISGTAITAADTGTVTSTMIADGTIVNADINTSAAIALTKLASDTTTALGVGTVELGHATDTTLARGSAGRLTVEGVNVVTISSSDTLTNKTISSGTLTGSLTAGGGTGTSGQFLKSTGTGVTWADATSSGGSDPVFQSMMYR